MNIDRQSYRAGAALAAWLIWVPVAAADVRSFDCVMQPAMTVSLSSPVAGIVDRLEVERSDVVEQDQVVAVLESQLEQSAVRLAQARAAYEGEIESRQASYSYARRRKDSMNELYGKKAVTFQEKDQADTDAAVARMELQEARHKRHVAQLELDQVQKALDHRTIRSPVSGIVVERLVSPGEYIDKQPLLRIVQLDPLHVEAIIPLSFMGSIQQGTAVEVVPEMSDGKTYTAQVSIVDPVIDAASGTFGIRIDLPNPDHAIPGGLRCTVSIPGS